MAEPHSPKARRAPRAWGRGRVPSACPTLRPARRALGPVAPRGPRGQGAGGQGAGADALLSDN
jgi:hypothetical protein